MEANDVLGNLFSMWIVQFLIVVSSPTLIDFGLLGKDVGHMTTIIIKVATVVILSFLFFVL